MIAKSCIAIERVDKNELEIISIKSYSKNNTKNNK